MFITSTPETEQLKYRKKGKVSPKKVAVLLDFVQMRGGGRGGPCPNFSSAFHKLYIMGQFGDGEGGGRSPLPKFFGTLALRKSGISCPNFGEGGSR